MKNIYTLLKWLITIIIITNNLGVLLAQQAPELMYFKFDASGNQQNYASSAVGNNPATLTGLTIGSSGQFGTALIGNGATSNYLSTGWGTSLANTGWTISMWINDMPSNSNLYYLWGDINANTFRCFIGGAAGAGNLYLRGGGLNDVLVTGVAPGPTVVHFVYNGSSIKVYLNGTYSSSTSQPSVAITGSGPFLIGAYSTLAGMPASSLMDEFRMYNRALSQAEITTTYNQMLPMGGDAGITAITNPPDTFCSATKTVSVTLKNFDNKTLTSAKINWKVNNVSQTIYNWTGSVAPSDSTNVNIGNYNFASGNSYTILAYTTLPNGGNDTITSNDSMTRSGFIVNPTTTANITVNIPSSICLGDSILLTANNGTGLLYQWRYAGVDLNGQTAITMYAHLHGYYNVIVNNIYNCPKTSQAVLVTVDTLKTPTATPAGPTTFCMGDSLKIYTQTGNGLNYQWRNNGANITGATKSTYYAKVSGSYKVVVTKNNVCIDSSSAVIIKVNPKPNATTFANGPTTFCFGDSVVLNADTGTGINYQWKKNGVSIVGSTKITYPVKTAGTYWVVVSNTYSCSDSSASVVVKVNPLPSATASPVGPTTFCYGDSVRINANTGTGLSYQWKNSGINIPKATKSYYYAKTSGSFKVVVGNTSGCSDSSTAIVVNVNPKTAATTTPAGSIALCTGDSLIINANTGSGLTYQWKENGINISGATASNITIKSAGSYKVVVTNSSSCIDSSQAIVVTVHQKPAAIAVADGPTSFCLGNSVLLKGNSGNGLAYQWYKDGSAITGETDTILNVKTSGLYTFVTILGPCSTTSSPVVVNVTTPFANLGKDTTVCANKSIVLNPGAGNTSYLWSTGATTPTIAVDSTGVGLGTKTISIKATLNGCDRYDTIKITFVICAGIKQYNNKNLINVFPNPSNGTFTLEFEDFLGTTEIRINDITGKTAYVENITLNGFKSSRLIDLSSKPKGLYFLRIDNKYEFRTMKIIIE